jgi:penicillin amidase
VLKQGIPELRVLADEANVTGGKFLKCGLRPGLVIHACARIEYLVTKDWPPPHRANRILELLDAMNAPRVNDMSALQSDVLSPVARRLLPLMLRIEPREESARQAVKLLANWDYFMRRERAEPLIYTAWLRQLIVALINDELGPELVDGYLKFSAYSGLGLVETALTNDPQWCDDIASTELETCDNLLEMALQRALDEIATELGSDMDEWRWGDLHRATFTHRVFTHVPIVRWFADLSIASDGGDHTVNRGTTPPARPGNSFPHIDGAGYRAVYDLANLDNSTFMIATGQSGNVLSRHYDDLLRRWRDGQYIRITKNHDDVQKTTIGTLLLMPAGVSSLPKEN